MDMQYADIIFFALLAAYILNRLRTVLGKDDGTRIQPRSPFALVERKSKTAKESEARPKGASPRPQAVPIVVPEPEISNAKVKKAIEDIKAKDASFSLGMFLAGAKSAFEMVMEAHQKGDKETLEQLLDRELYKDFAEDIKQRADAEAAEHTTLVAITSAEVIKAKLEKNMAILTVAFASEQIHVTKNREGKVIEGNPSLVEEAEDCWTFQRNITSSDPNWVIVALES